MTNPNKVFFKKLLIFIVVNIMVFTYIEFHETDEERYQRGVEAYQAQNYYKTYNIMSDLADKGIADAENMLASLYFNGQHVDMDKELALSWYQKAAEHGSKEAQVFLDTAAIEVNATDIPE